MVAAEPAQLCAPVQGLTLKGRHVVIAAAPVDLQLQKVESGKEREETELTTNKRHHCNAVPQ